MKALKKKRWKKKMKLKHKSGDELIWLLGKESEKETRSVGSGKVSVLRKGLWSGYSANAHLLSARGSRRFPPVH